MSYPYKSMHAKMTEKLCTLCREVKPIDQFYLKRRDNPESARSSTCKPCTILIRKQYPFRIYKTVNGKREFTGRYR